MALSKKELLHDGPKAAPITLVLAHGAGAPMDSPFMDTIAQGLGEGGIHVVRFEFPYMARRRTEGRGGAPDREPALLARWREVVAALGGGPDLFIGGKSLGGRMASLVADELGVRGLVCLGYPFHPPGKSERTRTAHLAELRTPTLIVQGERDPFGTRSDVDSYELSPAIRVAWLTDGDHSFVPRKKAGVSEDENLAQAVTLVREFLQESSR
jgi:predicted alpha/beta-hydrolase family hydrolase